MYRYRWLERFGFSASVPKGGVWIHAVSLGESIAATPLIEKYLAEQPNLQITVTCMTPTGSQHIKKTFGHRVNHSYLPYDIPLFLWLFIRRIRPRTLVIMETELWPNLVHVANKMGVNIILANGRLSERSGKGYKKAAALSYPMMQQINKIAAISPADGERFISLGLASSKLTVTGSIKFDIQIPENTQDFSRKLTSAWGASRPVLMAASTHEGEDALWLACWPEILKQVPNALLMLVPRHPERFKSVAQLVQQKGFALAKRSNSDSITESTQVYLGDSLGEMMGFYAACDVAFIGGSLVEHGGHNPLEAAALKKPIMSGPCYINFQNIVDQLIDHDGVTIIEKSTMVNQVSELLLSKETRQAKGEAAYDVVQKNLGSLQRLYDLIEG
jgi:3-deoxy-D-manno-octulosonic-acid transferase